jgi:hypothetical protein
VVDQFLRSKGVEVGDPVGISVDAQGHSTIEEVRHIDAPHEPWRWS